MRTRTNRSGRLLGLAALLVAGCHDLSYTAPCDLDPTDPRCPGSDASGDGAGDSGLDAAEDTAIEAAPDATPDAAPADASGGEGGAERETAVDDADSMPDGTVVIGDSLVTSDTADAAIDAADGADAPPSCSGAGPSTQPCGKCGMQSRSCVADGTYGAWGACSGEGPCAPGATSTAAGTTCAGALEVATQTCTSACSWAAPTCAIPKGWTKIAPPPTGFAGRYGHAAVWTGTEMIVWGGQRFDQTLLADGARYDLKTNTWKLLPAPPSGFAARSWSQAVWTGGTLLVGFGDGSSERLSTAATYLPATDGWYPVPDAPITNMALNNQSVWLWSLGKIVVSGSAAGVARPAAYSFGPGTWSLTAPCGACKGEMEVAVGGANATAFLWGGRDAAGNIGRGGATYDAAADSWSLLPSPPTSYADRIAPMTAPFADGFVSTGGYQIGFGFRGDALAFYGGGWHWLGEGASPQLSTTQHWFGALWCRSHVCWVWGGVSASPTYEFTPVSSMVAFDLDASNWTDLGSTSTLSPRYRASVVDTGSAVILWGGVSGGVDPPKDPTADYADGAVFVP